eukprot:1023619-Amorphochlora_amoeboformis.AAC.2
MKPPTDRESTSPNSPISRFNPNPTPDRVPNPNPYVNPNQLYLIFRHAFGRFPSATSPTKPIL